MAHALAVDLDSVGFTAEFATADETTDFGYMIVQQGPDRGVQRRHRRPVRGRPVIECRFVWKLGSGMTPNWPVKKGYVHRDRRRTERAVQT